MSRAEFVARLDGIGRLERDGKVVMPAVTYELIVIQRVAPDGEGGETIESLDTEATLVMKAGHAIPPALFGVPVELVLDDGRRLACEIRSADGTLSLSAPFMV